MAAGKRWIGEVNSERVAADESGDGEEETAADERDGVPDGRMVDVGIEQPEEEQEEQDDDEDDEAVDEIAEVEDGEENEEIAAKDDSAAGTEVEAEERLEGGRDAIAMPLLCALRGEPVLCCGMVVVRAVA